MPLSDCQVWVTRSFMRLLACRVSNPTLYWIISDDDALFAAWFATSWPAMLIWAVIDTNWTRLCWSCRQYRLSNKSISRCVELLLSTFSFVYCLTYIDAVVRNGGSSAPSKINLTLTAFGSRPFFARAVLELQADLYDFSSCVVDDIFHSHSVLRLQQSFLRWSLRYPRSFCKTGQLVIAHAQIRSARHGLRKFFSSAAFVAQSNANEP